MKIVTVVGARPQFVKAAVVSRAINDFNKESRRKIVELIVHTGQHFDENMSGIFFEQMSIPKPHYNLEINSLSHGAMTGKMLEKIEEILLKEKPDWVLVYGDTNSTIAGALAAKKLNIKVAHVEAGLRSFNMKMPEEINRILTDRISDVLFCPTSTAMKNLEKEGYSDVKRVNCGDVMNDAATFYKSLSEKPKQVTIEDDFILCTVHRQENTDSIQKLSSIFEAFGEIAKTKKVILPMHPRTISKLKEFSIAPHHRIQIIDPVGYFEMIWLLSNCKIVISDSGGLQKEAFFFGKPCITIREETEWTELVDNGVNFIAGSNKNRILDLFKKAQTVAMDFKVDLYGNGDAGNKIVKALMDFAE